jgi:hypothetical protein
MSDLEVDDILGNADKKKKIKSGQKGKRHERDLCKVLTARFQEVLGQNPSWGLFSRSVGSGNRWGQGVYLSKSATNTFSGDIACPDNFKFVVESKGGYNDVDLCCAFAGGCKQVDDFLAQVSDDAQRSGRKPILIWRKDRKPRLAFLKTGEVSPEVEAKFGYLMRYRDWTAYNLEDILTLPDEFFFEAK